ncbi:hypothetical protein [Kribbella sp. NPDC051137]|uniref:hypothetical protein n=1 Tax=Kribbella sp. NPDC051137 TaxID=3155045 RepID=UPI002F88EBA8
MTADGGLRGGVAAAEPADRLSLRRGVPRLRERLVLLTGLLVLAVLRSLLARLTGVLLLVRAGLGLVLRGLLLARLTGVLLLAVLGSLLLVVLRPGLAVLRELLRWRAVTVRLT